MAGKNVASCVREGSGGESDEWSCSKHTEHFLSSKQLELWRKILRQDIEEDLQRQVYDRLALRWQPKTGQSPRQYTTKRQLLIKQPSHEQRRDMDCQTVRPVLMKHMLTVSESNRAKKTLRHKDHIQVMSSNASKSVSLQHYVNSKYGMPLDQLSHVLNERVMSTRAVDTSGNGQGPVILIPIEVDITLPTPTHITPTSHTTSTLDHMTSLATHTTICSKSKVSQSLQDTCDGSSAPDPQQTSFVPCTPSLHRHTPYTSQRHTAHTSLRPISHTSQRHTPHTSLRPISYTSQRHTSHRPICTEFKDGLQFESRFEGGNLHRAQQVGPFEYNLWLNFDLYSTKHTQWFYFQVRGMVAMATYTFHIVNLYKSDSLYNNGLQPLLYSCCEVELGRKGWIRIGRDISHNPTPDTQLFTLSWNMEFPHTDDQCYLAHCYPYPYSRLLSLLHSIEACPQKSRHVHREILCKTLAGNECPLLTITDFQSSSEELKQRVGVVVTARVHPGETNSSWIMEGLLSMLIADTPHAKALRTAYVFKVVPMLNPDGVIVGNYRTSLAGVDLNRVYKRGCPELFPTVSSTKAAVDSLITERKVLLYIDLHGHSRKHNVFMYGCHAPQTDHTNFLRERLFPFLLAQQVPKMFSFASCKFAVQRCKESTGRVVMWRKGIPHSLTLEATFAGSTLGANSQFTCEDLLELGRQLGEAVFHLYRLSASRSLEQRTLGQLAHDLVSHNLPDLVTTHNTVAEQGSVTGSKVSAQRSLRRFMKFDLGGFIESSTSGSDSENDNFEYRRKRVRRKKVKSKTGVHIQTQSLLSSLPTPLPQDSLPSQYTPSSCQARPLEQQNSIPAVNSCVVFPPLVHFSALPKLSSCPSWKFVDKYKGRSNGGIPMFSEERIKERAQKRMQSVSMVQPFDLQQDDPHKIHTETKAYPHFPVLWRHTIGEELVQARSQCLLESTVARRPEVLSRQPEALMLQYVRFNESLRGLKRESKPSPTLRQFIKDLWSKHSS